ncbi:YbjQ family protein [Shewanella sp. YIC-542]|uniref:YbjQ family protein n=1 Tax=Shewanella mytili TaxID=3377111 RepID=UPI00398F8062
MLLSTTDTIPGYDITEFKGMVCGNIVQSKHLGRDIMAGLKTIIGGEIAGYSEMLSEARERAVQRMVASADELGANAIVNVRFTTSTVSQGMAEILAYGTAVSVGHM